VIKAAIAEKARCSEDQRKEIERFMENVNKGGERDYQTVNQSVFISGRSP